MSSKRILGIVSSAVQLSLLVHFKPQQFIMMVEPLQTRNSSRISELRADKLAGSRTVYLAQPSLLFECRGAYKGIGKPMGIIALDQIT